MAHARTALCMDCRTALAPGEHCDAHPKGRVLDLADPTQRVRAIEAVWGPPHLRVRKAAEVGGVGGGAGGLAEGCGACGELGSGSGELAVILLVIAVAALAAVLLYYLIKYIVYRVRMYRARPRPSGSNWQPPRPRRTLRGKVRDAVGTTAPLSSSACAAWGVVLEHDRAVGGYSMLRDGATAGLTIELDDGRLVKLPAGRVRVEGAGSREDAELPYLLSIDPNYVEGDANSPIACDDAREVRVAIGDTVEVIGGLESRFDPNAPAGYREAPDQVLVVAGMPTLVRIS